MNIEKILVGADLGHDTERVLAYASCIAQNTGASLNLIYVLDYLVTPPAYLAPYLDEEKKVAEKSFSIWEKQLREKGLKVKTEVITGRLHESFETVIEKFKTDMIVIGFRSHALRRSSSERLIKGIKIPMFVVRGKKTEAAKICSANISKILCPIDFSETSLKALKAANELKNVFSSELHVVHVLPSHVIEEKATTWADKDVFMQELFDGARVKLDAFLGDADIKDKIIERGEPYKKITALSSEKDIDLIVMGARGLGLIKEMIIGSVTDSVVKSSPCPVLVIH